MIFVLIFFVLSMLICVGMLYRNQFVFKCRMYATDLVSDAAKRVIHETEYSGRFMEMYQIKDTYPEYNSMMFNLNAWNFQDLYPDLEGRLKDRFDMIKTGVPSYDTLVDEFGGE